MGLSYAKFFMRKTGKENFHDKNFHGREAAKNLMHVKGKIVTAKMLFATGIHVKGLKNFICIYAPILHF
jgi:hypothetical protein